MTSAWRIAPFALLALSVAPAILADEFKPAYLKLTKLDATRYAVLWKVPALDENTTLGIEHILLGVDHLLFVLALVLLVDGTRRLLWTIRRSPWRTRSRSPQRRLAY